MIKKLAATGVLGFAVAASALAAAPAQAAAYGGHGGHGGGDGSNNSTSHNFGLLNGNQVNVPINAAIDVCGNNIIAIGFSHASCKGGAVVKDK